MKSKIKRRLAYFIIISIIAISIILVSILCNYNEKSSSYILGFGTGLLTVSIIRIIQLIIVLKDNDKLKKMEIAEQDERNIKIINNSYALTFRIAILIEAIACIISTALNKINISYTFGMVIGVQLIIYVICYYIISKKI